MSDFQFQSPKPKAKDPYEGMSTWEIASAKALGAMMTGALLITLSLGALFMVVLLVKVGISVAKLAWNVIP